MSESKISYAPQATWYTEQVTAGYEEHAETMSRAKQDSARKIKFPVLFRRRQRTKTASSKGLAEKVRISKCEHNEERVRLDVENVSNSPVLRRLTHERGTIHFLFS